MAKYGVLLSPTLDRLVVVKTTVASPIDSDWDSQDGEVDFKTISVKSLWAFEHASDIHIATQQENGRVAYHVFDPGTDTWTIKDETVAEAGDGNFDNAPANPAVSIALRSDNNIVIVAAYNDGTNERLRVFTKSNPLPAALFGWGQADSGRLGDGTTVSKSSPVQLGALSDWTKVSGGQKHSLALKTDGTLWAWGESDNGRLGNGTITPDLSSPVQIGALTDWAVISAGWRHSLAVKDDGTLWAWGGNGSGRLGDGTIVDKSSPVQIGSLTDWVSVASGNSHSLAVKADGTLWAWGLGLQGQLGDGTNQAKSSPVQIGALTDWVSVSAGNDHSHAIKNDGTLWAWGDTSFGQLGNGSTTPDISSPVQIGSLTDWASVSAGAFFSLAHKTDGTLWAWGDNSPSGQLGDGTIIDKSSPVQIGALTDWASVSGGGFHSLAVKNDGTLWAWGLAGDGQLGDGSTASKSSPVQIGALNNWASVEGGETHSLAVKAPWINQGEASGGVASTNYTGVVVVGPDGSDRVSWAYKDDTNDDVDLRSISSADAIASVTEIDATADIATLTVAPGIIDGSNKIYLPYVDADGQISIASWTSGAAPTVALDTTLTARDVEGQGQTSLSFAAACMALEGASDAHLVYYDDVDKDIYHEDDVDGAVGSDTLIEDLTPIIINSLFAWGDNSPDGQLGDGTTTDRSSPVQIGALLDWASIAAGDDHSLAVKDDGTLFAWGDANSGRLGDGTVIDKSSPVQIGALTDWASVSGGGAHSLAVKTDNTLWAWGAGGSGRLGDGTITTKSSPVQIGSLTDWASVAANNLHSLAVKTDNTLWAWGSNADGQLGDGTVAAKSSPVQIGALTDWASIDSGTFHSLAVKDDGTLWAWGDTSFGAVGNGSTNPDISSPVQIGSLTDWASVSGGGAFSLAVKTDGTLWAWGTNGSGQLGDGTSAAKSSPVQIGSLTDWVSVSGGKFHSLAVKNDGTLWAWGQTANGQVGNESLTPDISSPVQIGTLTDWANVSGGEVFSLAVKTALRNRRISANVIPLTLVYFFVDNGVTKYGTVALAAPAAAVARLLMLMGVGL